MRWGVAALLAACAVAVCAVYSFSREDVALQAGTEVAGPMDERPRSSTNAGHTRSIAQSVGQHGRARLWIEQPFNVFEVQRLANSGDAAAQRKLAQIYESCLQFSTFGDRYLDDVRAVASSLPTRVEAQLLLDAASHQVGLCANVDDGQRIPLEAIRLWMESAARGGDVAAEAKAATWSMGEGRAELVSNAWTKAFKSADGEAMFALSDDVSNDEFLKNFGDVVEPEDASAVVALVACRLGVDCAAGGQVMRSMCLESYACLETGYEEFLYRHRVLEGRQSAVSMQVESVLRALNQRKE